MQGREKWCKGGDLVGYVTAEQIQKAGDYLLKKMAEDGILIYSDIYDGTNECHELLTQAMKLEHERSLAEILVDLAVWEFETEGLIERTEFDESLADGESNYGLELTHDGRRFIADGTCFEYYGTEL